jgi:hypothetical protein
MKFVEGKGKQTLCLLTKSGCRIMQGSPGGRRIRLRQVLIIQVYRIRPLK